jgi:hypothetical protein
MYPVFETLFSIAFGNSGFMVKLLSGSMSGCFSSAITNPTDLIKVRQQGSTIKGVTVVSAFRQVIREEGVAALWLTGLQPTMLRAAVLAAVEMSSYDLIKPIIAYYVGLHYVATIHILSALLAGLCSSFASCPFDMARSRMMNQLKIKKKDSRTSYSSVANCIRKSVQEDGFLVLWSGWIAYFIRLGPNTILTFFFLERLRIFFSALFS